MRGRGRRSAVRLAVLSSAVLVLGHGTAAAATPIIGTTPMGTLTTVNSSPGSQYDSHISGSIVSYTDQAANPDQIRYFDLSTSLDSAIPTGTDSEDFLSQVDGSRIVFTRQFATSSEIYLFDISTSALSNLPSSGLVSQSAIGGDTVAWVDFGFGPTLADAEIFVHDLSSGTSTRLTNDAIADQIPAVSPDGNAIVWTKCAGPFGASLCDIYQATRSGGVWTTSGIPIAGEESRADTNGSLVVYDSDRGSGRDVYWRSLAGGPEQQIVLSGYQSNPHISGNVITFESFDPVLGQTEVYLYDIAGNLLYNLTSSSQNESLNDVSVDGTTVRATWTRSNVGTGNDVHAFTFTLPPAVVPYTFTGFFSPIDNLPTVNELKAGAAVAVKFSLDGNQGLNIFETGYPKSQTIPCDSTAPVDGVEETLSAGGSSLSFDATSDIYSYVWKTDKSWANSCRQLVLKLTDGTFHRANFKLK
jgi:hypothetical protein